MKITTFGVVPVGGTILRHSHIYNPPYVKISNSDEIDIASAQPVGNVAPYGYFRQDEGVFWLDAREAAEAAECFRLYRLGVSLKDDAYLYNGSVYLKARVLRLEDLRSNPFHG